MKFYSTILIAILLFGLCLIERKAKEEDLLRDSSRNVEGKLSSFPENISNQEDANFATNFASDSLGQMTPKPVLNISLNSPFLTGN